MFLDWQAILKAIAVVLVIILFVRIRNRQKTKGDDYPLLVIVRGVAWAALIVFLIIIVLQLL